MSKRKGRTSYTTKDGKTVSAAGLRRRRFFEEVGDLAQWRGRAARFKNRKREANKKAARGRSYPC